MRRALALIGLAATLGACGLDVQPPDLFQLTRTGQGSKLTLLVSDSGAIRCDGAKRSLPDALLLRARDLADSLAPDAKSRLRIPPRPGSVYRYTIRLQEGTISFPDNATAGGRFPVLAQAELFALQAAQQACGLSG